MLIKTETTLALRCPDCGRSTLHTVSRFTFGRGKSREIVCPCGSRLLLVSAKTRSSYSLEIHCAICESTHVYRLTAEELWPRDLFHLSCQETGLELGCVGPHERVRAHLKNKEQALEILVEEMGGQDYFQDAEVMLSTLTHVHTLAEEGSLYCPCGENRIELEIFPDRVELHCRHCHRMCLLPAAGKQDFARLEVCESIELARRIFSDRKKRPRRRKRDNHNP